MGEEVGHPRPFLGQGIVCEDPHLVYFVLFSSSLAFFSHGFFVKYRRKSHSPTCGY